MANKEILSILKQGPEAWSAWRDENHDVHLDLSLADLVWVDLKEMDLNDANLSEADLRSARLSRTKLYDADLSRADLSEADARSVYLSFANLSGANLTDAYLSEASLNEANLTGAYLTGANLSGANLTGADLSGANLEHANLVGADCTDADLSGCRVHGISAWKMNLNRAVQQNLVITERNEPEVTVDNIEVAQLVYLMLHNQKIRDVIDTITSKAVLILGRFTFERRAALDALREELRRRGYVPILFDFEKPRSQTTDETITLLARMARFVIADISDAKSVLQELRAIVPDLPTVAVQPLILRSQEEPGMFDFFNPRLRPSVLETHRYDDLDQLITDLPERVIAPAERKVMELRGSSA